jgi:HSP20 family protein
MELMRWKPSGEITSLRKEMDNLWRQFLGDATLPAMPSGSLWPTIDIEETENSLLVKAELPGMDAKDVSVTISDDILTIQGEKKKEEEKKEKNYYCSESYSGFFKRSVKLPANVKTDKVEATFEKGVLHIDLAKTEESKKKQIEIKVK